MTAFWEHRSLRFTYLNALLNGKVNIKASSSNACLFQQRIGDPFKKAFLVLEVGLGVTGYQFGNI